MFRESAKVKPDSRFDLAHLANRLIMALPRAKAQRILAVVLLATSGDARSLFSRSSSSITSDPTSERSQRSQQVTLHCGGDARRRRASTTDLVAASSCSACPPKEGVRATLEKECSRNKYYQGVFLAGAAACSITHTVVIPLDVIKTRMQTDANAAAAGAIGAAIAVFKDSPGRGLFRLSAFFSGLPPTAFGYFLQGGTKFGGYEVLKHQAYSTLRASGGEELKKKWQLPVMLASAASAEMVATVLLAPWEVLKLRMQIDSANAARGALATLRHVVRTEGVASLYKGLTPIAMRQLPYTMTKLVAYELFVRGITGAARRIELAYELRSESLRPAAIVLAGLLAGAAAAVVSHPADLLLTRLCGTPTGSLTTNVANCVIAEGSRPSPVPLGSRPCTPPPLITSLTASRWLLTFLWLAFVLVAGLIEQTKYLMSLGVRGAYSGLAPRLVMISAMTGIQFTIYEGLRTALGSAGRNPYVEPTPADCKK